MTKKEYIDLVIVRITGGKPSDDLEIDARQVEAELNLAANALLSSIQDKLQTEGGLEYVYGRFDGLAISEQTVSSNMDTYQARYYSTLPSAPTWLQNDMGLPVVETSGGVQIKRQKVTDQYLYKYLPHSSKVLSYYRIGNKIYYTNIPEPFAQYGKVNIVIAIATTVGAVSDNDEYPIPTYLSQQLIDLTAERLLKQMQLPQDLANDGRQ